MSTNNNHFSRSEKETKPKYKSIEDSSSKMAKFSSVKLQSRMDNRLTDCNAVTLSERGIKEIIDMDQFSGKLRRLDLSKNTLNRLAHFQQLRGVSMLNVSENELQGDSSLDELRYLTELRTLNISHNPKIKGIRSHVIKPVAKLQALIATNCGFSKVGFLKHCQELNTLVLSKNDISTWVPPDVGALEKLQKISLGFNKMTVVPDLHTCTSLTEVRLNGNLIKEVDDRFVRFAKERIKTLDLSSNQIASWDEVDKLRTITALTNLGIKGNPLPVPPLSSEELGRTLKEDVALAKGTVPNQSEQHVRQYCLVLFQREVGKENKVHEQLIVLDQKRVKVKWTQGGASASASANAGGEKRDRSAASGGDDSSSKRARTEGGKKKRGKKPELSALGGVGGGDGGPVLSLSGGSSSGMKKRAAPAKAIEAGQVESGVLAVEDTSSKDKDGNKKDKRLSRKEKKEQRKSETVAEVAEKDQQKKEEVLAALAATPAAATSVGTGGDSAW
jgi:hypothetical protein